MFEKCLYFTATKFTRLISSLWEEAYRPINLSPSHAYLMMLILENPGDTPKKLSEKMDLKLSTVSRLIDGLFVKGFIIRKKINKDKRECSVYPTELGVSLKNDLVKITKKLHKKIRKILGNTDVSDAVLLLKKFSKNIKTEKCGG